MEATQFGGTKRWQISVSLVVKIHTDLREVQHMKEIRSLFQQELGLLYITAKKSEADEPEIYVPVTSLDDVSTHWIERAFNLLCKGRQMKSITLAMQEDSTIRYFRLIEGVVLPEPEVEGDPRVKQEMYSQTTDMFEENIVSEDPLLMSREDQ